MKSWMVLTGPLAACAACSSNDAIRLDGGATPSDGVMAIDAHASSIDAIGSAAYSHTITIDGIDDFTPDEAFTTTTATYGAHVTWDATDIYVGYTGDDISGTTSSPSTKWVFAYLDIDPGAATGSPTSEQYNTELATFPSGFAAEFYARWKCDGTYASIQQYSGGAWSTMTASLDVAHQGDYVEFAIPRTLLAASTKAGVITYMLDEGANMEGQYAGLYVGNFTDGYAENLALTAYLAIDFTSSRVPDDSANEAH